MQHSHEKIEMDVFEAVFSDFEAKYPQFIAIFKGSVDPVTKINWCSDCTAIEEPLKNELFPITREKNLPVLEVSVGSKEMYVFFGFLLENTGKSTF